MYQIEFDQKQFCHKKLTSFADNSTVGCRTLKRVLESSITSAKAGFAVACGNLREKVVWCSSFITRHRVDGFFQNKLLQTFARKTGDYIVR